MEEMLYVPRREYTFKTSENWEENVRGINSSKIRGTNDLYDRHDCIIMNCHNSSENSKYLKSSYLVNYNRRTYKYKDDSSKNFMIKFLEVFSINQH